MLQPITCSGFEILMEKLAFEYLKKIIDNLAASQEADIPPLE
jgi:hypothetical protein